MTLRELIAELQKGDQSLDLPICFYKRNPDWSEPIITEASIEDIKIKDDDYCGNKIIDLEGFIRVGKHIVIG